jgi:hypothetical protein
MAKVINHLFGPDELHLKKLEESLFLAASELAKKNLVENIGVEAIVNEAQVSRKTFYKIFKSADVLFGLLGKKLINEMMEYFLCHSPQIPDVAKRVATKTKWALLIATSMPFLTKLLLKAEWPSLDPNHILYKDIEKDFLEGVDQGYFSDIPSSVGVNIIIGCLRGGCKDLLEKRQPEDYVNKVVCQVLISLGVDEERAYEISTSPTADFSALPIRGLVSKVLTTQKTKL